MKKATPPPDPSLLVFCERCHDFIRARFKHDRDTITFDGDGRELAVREWAMSQGLAIIWEVGI